MQLLDEQGIDFDRVNYFVDPLDGPRLRAVLDKARLSARDVIRTREPLYRELGLGDDTLSEVQLLDALVENPELLQRPIVERGDRAVLGRPLENVYALL